MKTAACEERLLGVTLFTLALDRGWYGGKERPA